MTRTVDGPVTGYRARRYERENVYFASAMRRVLSELNTTPTMHEIRAAVAKAFGIDIENIIRLSWWNIDIMARRATMVLGARLTTKSHTQIGMVCGNADPSTVGYACRKYNNIMDKVLGVEVVKKMPRRLPRAQADARIHLETLRGLIAWSVDDTYSATEDILPHLAHKRAFARLVALRGRGHAESMMEFGVVYWRVTPAGRDRMKELEVM
jgi:Bacterial dnaA protein helix-turn-helix